MRRRRRLAAVTGAVAAAAIPLWPSVASAGSNEPPDQEAKSTFYVEVTTFITCQVNIEVQRFGSNLSFSTQVVSDEPECLDNGMSVYGEFTDTAGNALSASSGGTGHAEGLQVQGVGHVSRTIHGINFTACNCGQTVELHPK
jgi:hypothetical protein